MISVSSLEIDNDKYNIIIDNKLIVTAGLTASLVCTNTVQWLYVNKVPQTKPAYTD